MARAQCRQSGGVGREWEALTVVDRAVDLKHVLVEEELHGARDGGAWAGIALLATPVFCARHARYDLKELKAAQLIIVILLGGSVASLLRQCHVVQEQGGGGGGVSYQYRGLSAIAQRGGAAAARVAQ